mmetsp:Transcript_13224/g.25318  ORF Transcript_13224/g.25318 Transcript_13224/m.25318 type:complete len:358 (-) Transcript_13224:540-1613(-)|eukprot:CAMPEP_0170191308 /NCGR_PEP_ID=MMETSP0040_2-20121228/51410_1 /TAXON_ID=641309 /ORGANISM="Lotharella oceanica, Strain CCMP622" /LENGTH=357 /DNA_ID=CAMNT_0010439367 /DNA_START=359 /DNA_END=1432 /DNA_ORIENTATION=+
MTLPCGELDPDYGCEATFTCEGGELFADTKGCCAHCRTTEWENGTCSETCGIGKMTQTREIQQEPDEKGKGCGDLVRHVECNLRCCPVDCVLGDWVESACSTTCGCGVIERKREILVKPSCGGRQCANRQEFLACENKPCDEEDVPFPARRIPDDNIHRFTVLDNDVERLEELHYDPTEPADNVDPTVPAAPAAPAAESCVYGHWENNGTCSVRCGKGKQLQVKNPIKEHKDRCSPQYRDIDCETHCGVDTRIWKQTHCSGIDLDRKYLDDFHEKTDIGNCREQPGEEDATAIANCVEKCNSLSTCAGFTFERAYDNSNRCCFFSDTSYKQYGDMHQACFEKVKPDPKAPIPAAYTP